MRAGAKGYILKLQPREVQTFTHREANVMRLIAKGYNVQGEEPLLRVTAHTITSHIRHLPQTPHFIGRRGRPEGPRGAGSLT